MKINKYLNEKTFSPHFSSFYLNMNWTLCHIVYALCHVVFHRSIQVYVTSSPRQRWLFKSSLDLRFNLFFSFAICSAWHADGEHVCVGLCVCVPPSVRPSELYKHIKYTFDCGSRQKVKVCYCFRRTLSSEYSIMYFVLCLCKHLLLGARVSRTDVHILWSMWCIMVGSADLCVWFHSLAARQLSAFHWAEPSIDCPLWVPMMECVQCYQCPKMNICRSIRQRPGNLKHKLMSSDYTVRLLAMLSTGQWALAAHQLHVTTHIKYLYYFRMQL